jgi:hypothetical protein
MKVRWDDLTDRKARQHSIAKPALDPNGLANSLAISVDGAFLGIEYNHAEFHV